MIILRPEIKWMHLVFISGKSEREKLTWIKLFYKISKLNQHKLSEIFIINSIKSNRIKERTRWVKPHLYALKIKRRKFSIIKEIAAAASYGGFPCGSHAWVCSCIAAQAGDPDREHA